MSPVLTATLPIADADSTANEALARRAQDGDRAAFETLVRSHQRRVYHLALRYVKRPADAQDIAQKTFVRAYRSLDRFRGDASFRTWLYRIAINLSLNHLRDSARERPSEIDPAALSADASGAFRLIARERSAALRAAIDELPDKQRLVVELRVFDELSFREVAALANCTENSAKVNFHHAVKKLRALLTASDGDEA